ncbi:hypothetical protein BGW36DRAFT_321877 [Talaromyces proteolyticus]|uniref:Uncharacterized protein n=1 Tax=Talaromyces proteolyticus TaxID=1131652 RepID=A0AAD4KPN3_9EURO|nr:uncharacterized protein BGW36DRAFT_321877 [Talaromyces proteolyticus]KAH8696549.1 hypothetical protein BGW36DRAFT_321877 [Talaromyces proteolyticus]
MAHQAHNIAWHALTSNLKFYSPKSPSKDKPTNLYFQFNPNQTDDIRHFAISFAKNIREHTACERKKYLARFDVPNEDDVLLTDATTQKISPLVYKWRHRYHWDLAVPSETKSLTSPSLRRLCTHNDGFRCRCAIPFQERKVSSFLRQYTSNRCYEFFKLNTEAFYNIELVKTLLLYREMEPILRVCAHPNVDIEEWQSQAQCYCEVYDAGWDIVYESALNAYLCLNILYEFPALWDSTSSSSKLADYRSTKLYQRTLRTCTYSTCTSEIAKYPHRAFFGISDDQFKFGQNNMPDIYSIHSAGKYFEDEKNFPYGLAPIEDFLSSKKHEVEYLPDIFAVAVVRDVLRLKSLPEELVYDVMERADYTVKRRLIYPDDPFHPGNRDELQRYLKYCWQLVVNCNMMAEELEVSIEWDDLIYKFLSTFLSSPGGRKIGSFYLFD